jgi:hypothetical protein
MAGAAHGDSFLNELYNTGVDDSGAKLSTSVQTLDSHYSVSSDPAQFTSAYAVDGYDGYWNTADYGTTSSQWISPLWNGGQAGEVNNYPNNQQFYYTLSFNLTNATNVDVKGAWMADNGCDASGLISQILVNGVPTGQKLEWTGDQYEPFGTWKAFELNGNYFKTGENTITFSVTNWAQSYGNPTGLRVAFASASSGTPEPYTLVLGAAAFMTGIVRGKNRRRV